MEFSAQGAALRLQKLPRRVPDPQSMCSIGTDELFDIGKTLFFDVTGWLACPAAQEHRAATQRSRLPDRLGTIPGVPDISTAHAAQPEIKCAGIRAPPAEPAIWT